jgi:hypothetical protein
VSIEACCCCSDGGDLGGEEAAEEDVEFADEAECLRPNFGSRTLGSPEKVMAE